jgi:hypothetical protein
MAIKINENLQQWLEGGEMRIVVVVFGSLVSMAIFALMVYIAHQIH